MKGGYKIISFGGKDISQTNRATIPGIYEKLESGIGKPTLFTGVVIEGEEVPSFYGTTWTYNSEFSVLYRMDVSAYYVIRINSNNEVYTVRNIISSGAGSPGDEDGPSASM